MYNADVLYVFSRVTLLELLLAQLREEESECGIPAAVASFLASSFQNGCNAVLTLASGSVSSNEVQLITHFPEYA